jgi:hypothetical protein
VGLPQSYTGWSGLNDLRWTKRSGVHLMLLEERYQAEIENAGRRFRNSEALLYDNAGTKSPFAVNVEEKCEECGGYGYYCGSFGPTDP